MIDQLAAAVTSNPAQAAAALERLDRHDPGDRASVLAVANRVAEQFVVPAASLLTVSSDGTRHFDLEELSGRELPGLLLGLLSRDLPDLASASDPRLAEEALAKADLEIPDPVRRERFLRGWAATRAASLVRGLLRFVAGNLADEASNEAEIAALRHLLARPLPSFDADVISSLVERRTAENA